MFELSKQRRMTRLSECYGVTPRRPEPVATRTGPSIEGNGDAHEPDESVVTPVDFHKVFIAIAGVATVLAVLAWMTR